MHIETPVVFLIEWVVWVINRGVLVSLKQTISRPTKCIGEEKRIPSIYWWLQQQKKDPFNIALVHSLSPSSKSYLVRMVSTSRAVLSPFPGKDQNDLVCLVDVQLGHQVLQLVDQDGGALDHHNHHPHQQEQHGHPPGHQVLQLVDQEGRGQGDHPTMWDGDQLPEGDGDDCGFDIGPCNFWKSPNIKPSTCISGNENQEFELLWPRFARDTATKKLSALLLL